MAQSWFYQTSEGQQSEPVGSGKLRRLAEAGIVRPDTLVRQGDSARWVRAENVRGLFQRSTPAPSLGASPAGPPPLPKSSALVNEASEEPQRIPPVTWAAIIVGSGTVLLLLWALVFRGHSEPQQQAEKDQRPAAPEWRPPDDAVAIEQQAESGTSAPIPEGWELVAEPPAATWGTDDEVVATAEEVQAMGGDGPSQAETGNVKTLELADLAELVGPSVVQVDVTGPDQAGTGSGFVLDKLGTIVTNFHVIEDATAGRIVFSDRTSAPITGYRGVWPEKDIALVRVECPPNKLHPLRLATSAPRQGERVAAFGSPLGLQQSLSEGIVSAVRESEELRTLGPIDINARLIQTTTPISHGNSGGPLVDVKGMVVGVNTMTFRPLGGENVNFAVAVVELPPLLLAKSETPSPLPASDPAAGGILVGHYASMTGSEAIFGQSTDQGIRLAIERINAAGGIKGREVKLITYDDQGKAQEAVVAVTRLIQQHNVSAVLGEVASSRSLAAGPVCQRLGVPMISPSSTNPHVTEVGDKIFRACFIDPFQGLVAAKFAREHESLKAEKVAILCDQTQAYSKGLAEEFDKAFKSLGGAISENQVYSSGDHDFTAQLIAIRATNPDMIFVPGYGTDVGNIALQARKLGLDVPLFGGDGWDSSELAAIAGDAANGCYYVNHYAHEDPNPRTQDFIAKYEEKYGATPDGLAALGYDAAMLLFDSMKRAESLKGDHLATAIAQTTNFDGVTGRISSIDEQRNAVKSAVILEIKNGRPVYLTTIWPLPTSIVVTPKDLESLMDEGARNLLRDTQTQKSPARRD